MNSQLKETNLFERMVVPDMDTQRTVVYPILLPTEDEGTWIENCVQHILDQTKTIRQSDHRFTPWHLGKHPVFSGTVIVRDADTDWAVLPLNEDPLFSGSNKVRLPKTILQYLKWLKQRGISFDAIYIAHEVPKDTLFSGDALPLELIAPPPSRAELAAERIGELSGKAWMTTMAPVLPVVSFVRSTAERLSEVDPILFGLKLHSESHPNTVETADWFYLCHWVW